MEIYKFENGFTFDVIHKFDGKELLNFYNKLPNVEYIADYNDDTFIDTIRPIPTFHAKSVGLNGQVDRQACQVHVCIFPAFQIEQKISW